MVAKTLRAIWWAENMMQALGLAGTVLISCVLGILLAAAGLDLDYLAKQTAVLAWLTMLTFGVKAVYQHKSPLVTAIVGLGIAQGILYFFTDLHTAILSIMCDLMAMVAIIYLTRKRKWI